jgi:hypothetical protein
LSSVIPARAGGTGSGRAGEVVMKLVVAALGHSKTSNSIERPLQF